MRFLLACLLLCFCCTLSAAEEENSFIVTDNGLEMFHWDLEFVRHAKQSIDISAVYLGGSIACELFTAIEARLEEVSELQVYLLCTPLLLEKKDWVILERLIKNYPRNFHVQFHTSVLILSPDIAGLDNHQKMFIVDEKYFSSGGTNLDEMLCSEGTWTPQRNTDLPKVIGGNLPAGARDQDIVGRGPLAKKLRRVFHQHFALWEHYNKTEIFEKDPEKFAQKNHYFPVTCQTFVEKFETSQQLRSLESDKVNVIFSGSYQKENAITKEYIRLVESAREEIFIANLYFSPSDPLFDALIRAVCRGVKLTIITNGVSDRAPEYTKFFCWANRVHYVPMLYGKKFSLWDAWSVARLPIKNTRIFEYHVKDILLHKKSMAIDGRIAVIGSYNFGLRSEIGDYESILVFDSKEIAEDLHKVYEKDLKFSREVSPEDARAWYFDPFKSALGGLQKNYHGLL